MGRFSRKLAPQLIEFAQIQSGMSVLDVGCGPGSLAASLAERVGPNLVSACDPSDPFVIDCATRVPGADVRRADAEELPWNDEVFDAALAQLVVNFMRDARAGVTEMRRVTRRGGVVAACTWDYAAEMQMLRAFWDAACTIDPEAPDEGRTMRFISRGELDELWRSAGLVDITTGELIVDATYSGFDELWESVILGVGPAGNYFKSLEPDRQVALREELQVRLGSPQGSFALRAKAWAVRGIR
jgi:SAM-dependent methyltransferase